MLHGGPGAAGYMAPVARALSNRFDVFEPLQRGSGLEPLTVARHVQDLDDAITRNCDQPPAIVGHSWGAMLALAHAGAHPDRVSSLVLVGCGTFSRAARARMGEILAARRTRAIERELELSASCTDPDERLSRRGRIMQKLQSCDLMEGADEPARCDARAHEETWRDALRLQEEGIHPKAFAAIRVPVLMLHGVEDPHPGPMVRDSLLPFIPQLEYVEYARCGHYPWLEKEAHEAFWDALGKWLSEH